MSESDKYEVLEKIGHGSFGVIRKVRRKTDGMILCRKEISYLKMSQKEREQLHAEFQILSTLRHPNIVGYYHREHLKATQDLHLYMEYCGNGDLGRVIRDLQVKNQYAEETFVWSVFAQLVTALFRCHYGIDPPEVGKNVLGPGPVARPKIPTDGVTILHRDLKPENVFLTEDNSVKLGDFGLSKMIQSHDFASTYVGTPFYMSPEICAAEKYTLKSDIWSLGCIVYELCAREPPFNAKSHYQLVQKIKEGKVAALPNVYSVELTSVIKDCLKVNPDCRPDTATLLNLPVVRLMRKEREVVEMSRLVKTKEDLLNKRIREYDQRVNAEKLYIRQEIDSSLRREWEVKARLEIDRLVNEEIDRLQDKFEREVQTRVEARVETEMQLLQQQQAQKAKSVSFDVHRNGGGPDEDDLAQDLGSSLAKSDYRAYSSVGAASADGSEFPSTTDITELSIDSPDALSSSASALKRLPLHNRTPFGRAQTMFAGAGAGTPMDVEMASPSPIVIASLSLSPRRNAATKVPSLNPGNIFAAEDPRWHAPRDSGGASGLLDSDLEDNDEDDDDMAVPSPTKMIRSSKNPFAKQRPALLSQKSAPISRIKSQQPVLPAPAAKSIPGADGPRSVPLGSGGAALPQRGTSPTRRLSKIPSAANLMSAAAASGAAGNSSSGNSSNSSDAGEGLAAPPSRVLARKPSMTIKKDSADNVGSEPQQLPQTAPTAQPMMVMGLVSKQKYNLPIGTGGSGGGVVRGRTLVELQQARAGGRPLSAVVLAAPGAENSSGGGAGASNLNVSPKRTAAFREHALARGNSSAGSAPAGDAPEGVAVWNPETCDEMPSPFLVRRKPMTRV